MATLESPIKARRSFFSCFADPPTMKNVCPYVQPLRNGFNIMPVSKAVQYYFHLNNEANKTIGEKMLKEVDLDSSELVQVNSLSEISMLKW